MLGVGGREAGTVEMQGWWEEECVPRGTVSIPARAVRRPWPLKGRGQGGTGVGGRRPEGIKSPRLTNLGGGVCWTVKHTAGSWDGQI